MVSAVRQKRRIVIEDAIAGFQYYEGPIVLGELKVGEALRLVPQPMNGYDWAAIEIYRADGVTKLGYVPRGNSRRVSRLIEAGCELRAKLIAVDRRVRPGYRSCRFRLEADWRGPSRSEPPEIIEREVPAWLAGEPIKRCRELRCQGPNRADARFCRLCGLEFIGQELQVDEETTEASDEPEDGEEDDDEEDDEEALLDELFEDETSQPSTRPAEATEAPGQSQQKKISARAASQDDSSWWVGWAGAGFVVGYLLMRGGGC